MPFEERVYLFRNFVNLDARYRSHDLIAFFG